MQFKSVLFFAFVNKMHGGIVWYIHSLQQSIHICSELM
jgi:hypothetical protein